MTAPPHAALATVVKRAVVTVTSISTDPTGPVDSVESKPAPIGAIVGGVVGGFAAVCIVAAVWYWCHRKDQQEKEERQRQLAARAASRTGSSRPSLSHNKSASSSIQSHEKDIFSGSSHSHIPPVPALPAQYARHDGKHYDYPKKPSPTAVSASQSADPRGYATRSSQGQHMRKRSDGRGQYVEMTDSSGQSLAGSDSVPSPNGSHASSKSSTSSSSWSSSSSSNAARNPSRNQRVLDTIEQSQTPTALAPALKYQPLRPSPLRVTAEEKKEDEGVPKWGSKPFRSVAAAKSSDEQQQQPAAVATTDPMTQPPRTSYQSKAVSGEWGIAYGDMDDEAGAFEHDDDDPAAVAGAYQGQQHLKSLNESGSGPRRSIRTSGYGGAGGGYGSGNARLSRDSGYDARNQEYLGEEDPYKPFSRS